MKKISELSSDELKGVYVETLKKIRQELAFKIADLCTVQNSHSSRLGYRSWSDVPKTELIYEQVREQEQLKHELLVEYNFCGYMLSDRRGAIKGRMDFEEQFPKKVNE